MPSRSMVIATRNSTDGKSDGGDSCNARAIALAAAGDAPLVARRT